MINSCFTRGCAEIYTSKVIFVVAPQKWVAIVERGGYRREGQGTMREKLFYTVNLVATNVKVTNLQNWWVFIVA